jgi:hypothetical protein
MENNMEQQPYVETAKEVAGKAIGRHGLIYITIIVAMGVGASVVLEEGKMAAVMGLLGASLTALISMLNGVAGANPKQDKPEFEIMKELIARLDGMADRDPMNVVVDKDRVLITKGTNETVIGK